MSNESLKTLHTALIDANDGYDKAIEKSEDAALTSQLRATSDLHRAAHGDVHRLLTARGEKPDEDGSFMGTVHRTVIAARSAIVGLDEGSLDAFASGEENNLEKYDDAIRDETDVSARETLSRHRQRLADQVGAMKNAAAAA
jgi:uncharacterized protein (TIGR02284 family)